MIPAIRAEFRKLFTVRTTYFILLGVAALLVFFAFYVSGWKADAQQLNDPNTFTSAVLSAISAVASFGALTGVLLVTHEYRFNTISYTLTAASHRYKVLLAKIFVMSCYAIVFTLLVGWLSPVLTNLGANAHHLHFVPQVIHHTNLLWRGLFYGWGYTMAGLLIATLVRNQIGSVVVLFLAPDTVESLLSLLFKHNTVYLPFTALSIDIGQPLQPSFANVISPAKAAFVVCVYLVVGWLVAATLFIRRDAN
jgi:ABC-2 type transport system permease protein